MRRSTLTTKDFPDQKRCAAFEGGAVYTAERGGRFYVIEDESTLADLLCEEDLADIKADLIRVLEFDTREARSSYLKDAGRLRPDHLGYQGDLNES